MKSIEEIQVIVNDLLAVCKKHNVMLVGSCYSEGIDGEILITDDPKVISNISAINVNNVYLQGSEFVVDAIG